MVPQIYRYRFKHLINDNSDDLSLSALLNNEWKYIYDHHHHLERWQSRKHQVDHIAMVESAWCNYFGNLESVEGSQVPMEGLDSKLQLISVDFSSYGSSWARVPGTACPHSLWEPGRTKRILSSKNQGSLLWWLLSILEVQRNVVKTKNDQNTVVPKCSMKVYHIIKYTKT